MRLLDRIVEWSPGERLVATKLLSADEDYLQDHFPGFPVMPGVLMLEAMYQAAAWLVRGDDDFAYSMVLLKEARNVKYSGFVRPEQTLLVTADLQKRDERSSRFKVKGTIEGVMAVNARIVLEHFNLADENLEDEAVDAHVRKRLRKEFNMLRLPLNAPESSQV